MGNTWNYSLVEVLVEASGDAEPATEDVRLAEAAEAWLLQHGWQPASFVFGLRQLGEGLLFWAEEDDRGLYVSRRENAFWQTPGDVYRVRSFRQALNMLTTLEILPPERFSTHGRQALADHAEACERAADSLETQGANARNGAAYDYAATKADGLREAAASARRHYPLRSMV